MPATRLFLVILLSIGAGLAHAQDAPGLGIGLFAVFVLLPMLPFILLVVLVIAIILLLRSKRGKETQVHHHDQEDKPQIGRLGE